MTLLTLFYNPLQLQWSGILWMLFPLCIAVATIYKTIRTNDIHRLPCEIAKLSAYLIGGLIVLAAGAWLIVTYWP